MERSKPMEMEIVMPGRKRVDALWKGFTIRTDQSERGGGEGAEPAPFDLFLASIGTCAGIYVLEFCEKRGVDPRAVKLVMSWERNPETHMISRMAIDIRLPAGFPEKYRNAVIRAADLCTVKKHMEHPPKFEVTATIGK